MVGYQIKNIVFDIGNVLVRWSPLEIARLTFGSESKANEMAPRIFQCETWAELNEGKLTEKQAMQWYQTELGLSEQTVEMLFFYIKESLIPVYGTYDLLGKLKKSGYKIFALTDNVVEIVAFLKQRYDFWAAFEGAVVSAEVGCLKPSADIYNELLEQYQLVPNETVFLDDVLANVQGAQKAGIHSIQFLNIFQCEEELKSMGVKY
ncbi:HAD family hydrolase [Vibrio marisflavi]|uniref:Alpha-D-glucose 1-phosphate phosphatase YihX n=1 Tax=Vibrio marisflavi CECT 7928 TaxID=634439 RepID=A0ABM9A3E8_9VIBR|nr:HAD family phosphatase [Vibrio marisflavi]CAH0539224.1 Alpha-D-glucose 1-phosphate phosphatase YihX [Vibrio marisflavi CECT 7928]